MKTNPTRFVSTNIYPTDLCRYPTNKRGAQHTETPNEFPKCGHGIKTHMCLCQDCSRENHNLPSPQWPFLPMPPRRRSATDQDDEGTIMKEIQLH